MIVSTPDRTVSASAPGGAAGDELDDLVAQARTGRTDAWEALVKRLRRVIWATVNRFPLSLEDRKDVFATTCLRLHQSLGSIREPARLPGWVSTTARHEAYAVLRARKRLHPLETIDDLAPAAEAVGADRLIDDEMRTALRTALTRLPTAWQDLVGLLLVDPPLPYDDISARLQIPQGSIGPTRQRCIKRLREAPELQPFLALATTSPSIAQQEVS
jgi:RNA polymerase sigma factor (sigma-70 family)